MDRGEILFLEFVFDDLAAVLNEVVGEVIGLSLHQLAVLVDKDRLHAELVESLNVAKASLLLLVLTIVVLAADFTPQILFTLLQ